MPAPPPPSDTRQARRRDFDRRQDALRAPIALQWKERRGQTRRAEPPPSRSPGSCGARQPATQPVDGTVVNNGEEVTLDPAVGIEASGLAPEREERLLDHVFCFGGCAQSPVGQAVCKATVSVVEFSHRVPIVLEQALKKGSV